MKGEVLLKAVWYPGERPPELVIQIPGVRWTAWHMRPSFWRGVIKTLTYPGPDRGGQKELERTKEVVETLKQAIPHEEQWWKETDEMEEEEEENS